MAPSVSRKHASLTIEPTGARPSIWGARTERAFETWESIRGVVTPLPLATPVESGSSILIIQRGVLGRSPLGRPVATATPARAAVVDDVVVEDEAMRQLHRLVTLVAQGTINVLITGETGTGKEVIARTLHRQSPRAAAPFLGVNLALAQAGGNQTRAAELLGVTRRVLGRRLERYGIAVRRTKA